MTNTIGSGTTNDGNWFRRITYQDVLSRYLVKSRSRDICDWNDHITSEFDCFIGRRSSGAFVKS